MTRELNQMIVLSFAVLFTAGAFLLNHFIEYAYQVQAQCVGSPLLIYADHMMNNL